MNRLTTDGDAIEHRVDFGAPDVAALRRIRERFRRQEPLVDEAAFDSATNPSRLTVSLADGIEAVGRFEIRFSERGYYGAQYLEPDADIECRFEYHPKPNAPDRHFHPPPDAPSTPVEPSCIAIALPDLLALALCHVWRTAYEAGDVTVINDAENPP